MKAIRAHYQAGRITLTEPAPDVGPVEVLVVFPEVEDDPWEKIIRDPVSRPALTQLSKEIREEISAGRATPLNPDEL